MKKLYYIFHFSAGKHTGGVVGVTCSVETGRLRLGGGTGRERGRRCRRGARGAAAGARAARVRAARVCAGPPARARLGRLGRGRLPLRFPHWG